jgi:inner membrane protein
MNDKRDPSKRPFLEGPGAKALLIAFLVLAFLLPLSLVQRVVDERRSTRDLAEQSIIEPAGGKPVVFGPFVVLPYELKRERETLRGEIVILPEGLSIEGSLAVESRERGVFSAPILEASIAMSGSFGASDSGAAAEALPSGARPLWNEARVALELDDLRSLAETPTLRWNGRDLALKPDARQGRAYARSLSARVQIGPGAMRPFSGSLRLRGGRSLSFLEPSGAVRASLSGNWPSPSFFGYSAPTEREFGAKGFSARWYLPESSQGLPRAFDSSAMPGEKIVGQAFGVELLDGVDAYAMSWRAVRYGLLFVIVPFAVLFLFELLSRLRVHPVQYVLLGLANCLFFLLALSLSEVLGFAWAYVSAAAVCTGLCGAYAAAALRSRKGLLMLPILGLLYAYLYLALRSEDYALLLGSLGLLVLLAAAMALTRKIDWYGARAAAEGSEP